jgi:uncharacterized protein
MNVRQLKFRLLRSSAKRKQQAKQSRFLHVSTGETSPASKRYEYARPHPLSSKLPIVASKPRRIAPTWHTILVLLAIAGVTLWGKIYSDHLRAIANSPRLPLYIQTAVFEWALLGLVLWRAPVPLVLGPRWQSTKRILVDVLTAAAFWILSGIVLVFLSRLLRINGLGPNVRFMLPRTFIEMAAWVGLCVTAGICEEGVFRGYLQLQFAGLTGSALAGILISAAIFGAGHAYQGLRSAILIACYGALFGLLAYWRKNVRPGILAHIFQDCVSGLIGSRLH